MRRLWQVQEKHTGGILLTSHINVLVLLPDGLLVDLCRRWFWEWRQQTRPPPEAATWRISCAMLDKVYHVKLIITL
jgi:hypothetical protein